MKINEILSERRKSLGITQDELAESIGVSKPRISEIERRVKYSAYKKLEAILSELQLSIQPDTADAGGKKENKTGTDVD